MEYYQKQDDQNARKFDLAFNMDRKYLDAQALFTDYEITSQQYQKSIPRYQFTDEKTIEEQAFDNIKSYQFGVLSFLVKKNKAQLKLQNDIQLCKLAQTKSQQLPPIQKTSLQIIPEIFPHVNKSHQAIVGQRQKILKQRKDFW